MYAINSVFLVMHLTLGRGIYNENSKNDSNPCLASFLGIRGKFNPGDVLQVLCTKGNQPPSLAALPHDCSHSVRDDDQAC